jgi:hypothetical protein
MRSESFRNVTDRVKVKIRVKGSGRGRPLYAGLSTKVESTFVGFTAYRERGKVE